MRRIMVLFDKSGLPKLYDLGDLIEIARLISDIRYTDGFLEAVEWEIDPTAANYNLSNIYVKEAIKSIKKCEEIAPEEIRREFNLNSLEKKFNKFLKK